jgi:hypothetical protein
MGSVKRRRGEDTRVINLLEEGMEHLLDKKSELEASLRGAQDPLRKELRGELESLKVVMGRTQLELLRLRPAPCQEEPTLLEITPRVAFFHPIDAEK